MLFLSWWDIVTQKIYWMILWIVFKQLTFHFLHIISYLQFAALSTHQILIICLLGALQEFIKVLVPVSIVYVKRGNTVSSRSNSISRKQEFIVLTLIKKALVSKHLFFVYNSMRNVLLLRNLIGFLFLTRVFSGRFRCIFSLLFHRFSWGRIAIILHVFECFSLLATKR